jgi:asparagine synthase (glutamine-hydrolysing)
MCGIAGRFHFKSRTPVESRDLERMNARMAHRGPDGEGYFLEGPLGLAHKRLSIIDLEGGRQPMIDDDLAIVFNGEIFNYLELFDELRPFGLVPKTKSDTEAILLAYRKWGLDFPSRLNGMFAIALYDRTKKRLILVRDRMGVKPLYYAMTDDGVAFASELKALRGGPGIDTTLDLEAFDDFMSLGYVVNPRCVVRGVKKLEPGTRMVIDERGVTHTRYWQLRFAPDESKSESEWADEVRAIFDDAVRLRLRADVPLGVLLSGGVDSTAIASTLVRQLGRAGEGVDSFCTGIDVPGAVNEFAWARKTAQRLGTRHHELHLSPKENGDLLIESARLLDEPLAEPMVAQLLGLSRL